MSALNGSDWHTVHHADVHFTDQEVWALSQLEVGADPSELCMSLSIAEHEMRCQRDMVVRGRRLWNYHKRVGDLWDILGLSALAAAQVYAEQRVDRSRASIGFAAMVSA